MTSLSGVLGLSQPLGRDAAQAIVGRMDARLLPLAFPGSRMAAAAWSDNGVALLASSPLAAGEEAPPFTLEQGHLKLALSGRIHNRASLMRGLGLPVPQAVLDGLEGEGVPHDVELLMAAYKRYGQDFVHQVEGDWAAVVWDGQSRRLLLAKDPTGAATLFWWHGQGLFIFSTSLQALLAAGPVPRRPDPHYVAGLLTIFYDPARPEVSGFDQVQSLLPGHSLCVQDGRIESWRWWTPERLTTLDGMSTADLDHRFRTLFQDAVRQRLRRRTGRVAANLSGGLDSGCVVSLAAPLLAARGERLLAYVHTPLFKDIEDTPGRTLNEWPLAQATARRAGAVDAVACPSPDLGPVAGLMQWLDLVGRPLHAAGNAFWGVDIARQAGAAGARVMLQGGGGNASISYNGLGSLWPRVIRLQWGLCKREVWSEAGGWRTGLRDRLVKPALRPGWHWLKRQRHMLGRDRAPGWQAFGPLQPAFAESIGLADAMRAAGHDVSVSSFTVSRQRQWRLGLLPAGGNTDGAPMALEHSFGTAWLDPTKDRRLVELCWQLPDELYWNHGTRRGMVRRALAGLLPDEVLNCTKKGYQASDLRQRLAARPAELRAAFDEVARHEVVRAWIDLPRLKAWVQATLDGPSSAINAFDAHHMMRALGAAHFVRRNT